MDVVSDYFSSNELREFIFLKFKTEGRVPGIHLISTFSLLLFRQLSSLLIRGLNARNPVYREMGRY